MNRYSSYSSSAIAPKDVIFFVIVQPPNDFDTLQTAGATQSARGAERLFFFRSFAHRLGIFILCLLCASSFYMPSVLAQSQPTPLSQDFLFLGNSAEGTQSVAWGDWDGDGDLDLAVANSGGGSRGAVNQIFKNEGGHFSSIPSWESSDLRNSFSLAWGDWDGDGDLDLAVGNADWHTQVFENIGGTLSATAAWESADYIKETHSVAWGDMDGDGYLDLAVGNLGAPSQPDVPQPDQVYRNLSGILDTVPFWESPAEPSEDDPYAVMYTYSIAWGDMDDDGDLELATGGLGRNRIYENSEGVLGNSPIWISDETTYTNVVAWADMDGDGDLDFTVGNRNQIAFVDGSTTPLYDSIYRNEDGLLETTPAWQSTEAVDTNHLTWGDWDSDGDLDMATAGWSTTPRVYQNDGTTLLSTFSWEALDIFYANSIEWGDMDNDGDLDLAIGNAIECIINACIDAVNRVYVNQQSGLDASPIWESTEPIIFSSPSTAAWGDVDKDGDLDLATAALGEPIRLYENQDGELDVTAVWQSDTELFTKALAWADVDGDGDLDLGVANSSDVNQIFLNAGGLLRTTPGWVSETISQTTSIAWGDWDGDGDLDLAVGNRDQPNEIYVNDGRQLATTPIWSSESVSDTTSIAWGDIDGDGDLDLVEGNGRDQPNQIYENDNDNLTSIWMSADQKSTASVAWGDVDGDGDLDLAVGNVQDVNQLFENRDGTFSNTPIWESTGNVATTEGLEWGDIDGDGDLDLAVLTYGNGPQIYENKAGSLGVAPIWQPDSPPLGSDLALGDVDNDGDLDIAASNYSIPRQQLYMNRVNDRGGLVNNQPSIQLSIPPPALNANFHASTVVLDSQNISISYKLFDLEGESVSHIKAWYSYNGGGAWQPAIAAEGVTTTNLQTSAAGVEHVFIWDTLASGFFGQSDNVRFRIDVFTQPKTASVAGVYLYPGQVPSPYQRPRASATTFPFRVRGTSVQVYSTLNSEADGVAEPAADVIVFRLRGEQTEDATLLANAMGIPHRTDSRGRLQGQGEVLKGDRLVAMQPVSITDYMPITFTNSIDLYYTSATPALEGIDADEVSKSGLQTLTVSQDNPLLLFNLDVSLEWDARNDPDYLVALERDLLRTSEILYDLTDGQAALGNVWVFHDKMRWLDAHITIHATNNLRPNASLGGIVNYSFDDTILDPTTVFTTTPTTISNAYLPGQVRIGTRWNRFGNKQGSQGEDWPRVLAHELGHYLFFQLDNYLGINEDGLLAEVDCQNSVMTDPYVDAYSEFLYEWSDDCLQTVANQTTGRYDWETIRTFYPMLTGDQNNSGPSNLPLAVTKIQFIEPLSMTQTLATPFFSLVNETGQPLIIDDGQARGYLYTTQNNDDPTDDGIVDLGSPGRDQLFARGASPGDRVCLFDNHSPTVRLGCTDVDTSEGTIVLNEVSDWPPDITVTPITSRTFTVSVRAENVVNISAQILPADGPTSEEVPLAQNETGFTQVITTVGPAFAGHVRVWVPEAVPYKEALTEFSLGPSWLGDYRDWDARYRGWDARYRGWDARYRGWDARYRGWDARYRGWDARYRGWDARYRGWDARYRGWDARYRGWDAPVHSPDGQVTIFNLNNILADNSFYRLQALSSLPEQPLWFTQVGQAYRFAADTTDEGSSISFRYLERDVPRDDESLLRLYYLPEDEEADAEWISLVTHVDSGRNSASARVQGEGIYALISTVEMPSFNEGWNNFGYPIQGSREIKPALAALDNNYTTVLHYESTANPPWLFYDRRIEEEHPALAEEFNTLEQLDFGKGYMIWATEPVTLYLGVEAASIGQDVQADPPLAIYYGWITPTATFTPTAGMVVSAQIGETICGTTQVQPIDDRLAYLLQVSSDSAGAAADRCTQPDVDLAFAIDGQSTGVIQKWRNGPAIFNSLAVVADAEPAGHETRAPDGGIQQAERHRLMLPFASQPLDTP